MTISPQKRQKQLAKKRAKRKLVSIKKTSSKVMNVPTSFNIGDIPIYESRISKSISEFGMGTVILSRKIAPGYVSASFFMIDSFCLGVKNANFGNFSSEQYHRIIENISQRETFVNAPPQCVRKLVEEAVNYAKDLGFRPHPDYQEAQKIFANIETESCSQVFEFGREGKPCYVAGPFDKAVEIKRIIEKLRRKCGPGGFKVFLPMPAEQPPVESETSTQETPGGDFSSVPTTPSTS